MFGFHNHQSDDSNKPTGHEPPEGLPKYRPKTFRYPQDIRDKARAEWEPLFEQNRAFMSGKGDPLTEEEAQRMALLQEICEDVL